ncbi:MAG: hypothetical protein ACYC3G_03645, partial [Minisyncoccota bacterium]
IFLGIFTTLSIYSLAEAHQPNFVNKSKEIKISNPEISQAFYGYLDGEPVTYSIDSNSPFQLYTGLLIPDFANLENGLSAIIKNNENKELANLDGLNNFTWQHYYEEFARDWYWKGPEFKKEVPAGKYTITISNSYNKGEYVLVVGEAESFPIIQMPKMFSELYKIKTVFFQKPWYSVLQNKIGKYLGIMILIIILLISGILFLKKLFRKNNGQ